MKKILVTGMALFSLLILLTAIACEEEPVPVADHLTCNIEGVSWKAGKSLTGTYDNGNIILNGISTTLDTLRLLIQDQQTGTYPIKNTRNICIYKKAGITYIPLNSAEAALTITSHDTVGKIIEGTFYYTADGGSGNWLVVTAGSFKSAYQ